MSLDKVLHKIQGHINDLAPMLETFVEDTIQPSVSDCESLQKQLVLIQEQLAVYKYNKLNKEISPSFNIHAKVSAQEKPEEKISVPPPPVVNPVVEEKPRPKPEPVMEVKREEPKREEVKPVETKLPEPERTEPAKQKYPLTIGLNDKFRFIKMLFLDNVSEYNIAVEQLGNLSSWHETEVYLNSLKNLYDWKETSDEVKHFYSITKKRFE